MLRQGSGGGSGGGSALIAALSQRLEAAVGSSSEAMSTLQAQLDAMVEQVGALSRAFTFICRFQLRVPVARAGEACGTDSAKLQPGGFLYPRPDPWKDAIVYVTIII